MDDRVISEIEFAVEWGQCDPAKILFYPNYFHWFDAGTRHLIDKANLSYQTLYEKYAVVGLPLVDVGSTFHFPLKFGDTVQLQSFVASWSRKSFVVNHRVLKDDRLSAAGHETRIWAQIDPENAERIVAAIIPDEVKAQLPEVEDDGTGHE